MKSPHVTDPVKPKSKAKLTSVTYNPEIRENHPFTSGGQEKSQNESPGVRIGFLYGDLGDSTKAIQENWTYLLFNPPGCSGTETTASLSRISSDPRLKTTLTEVVW